MTVEETATEPPEPVAPPWIAMLQAHADRAAQDPRKQKEEQ